MHMSSAMSPPLSWVKMYFFHRQVVTQDGSQNQRTTFNPHFVTDGVIGNIKFLVKIAASENEMKKDHTGLKTIFFCKVSKQFSNPFPNNT